MVPLPLLRPPAWCVPPAIWHATFNRNGFLELINGTDAFVASSSSSRISSIPIKTSCIAAIVPPVLAKLLVTCSWLRMGNPMARSSFSDKVQVETRVTYSAQCTDSTSSNLAVGDRTIVTLPNKLASPSSTSRVARYLSMGNR